MDVPNLSPLKGFNSFKNVYEISVKSHFGNILLFVAPKATPILIKGKTPEENTIYLGISVAKKIFRKAVVRNRIKRLIRESVRKNLLALAQNFSLDKIQIIMVAYKGEKILKPSEINLSKVDSDLSAALLKFCSRYLKRKENQE